MNALAETSRSESGIDPTRAGGRQRPTLAQRLVTGSLASLGRGRLELVLPDGETVTFGNHPEELTARIRVMDHKFFSRCVWHGDIGFAESYVHGEWETDNLTKVIEWFVLNIDQVPSASGSLQKRTRINLLKWSNRLFHLLRPNSLANSRRNIAEHYDLGNEFYRLFLDETMTYSCGLFGPGGRSLEDAQTAKYERLCQQLNLGAGDRVLEIGCGWGGFAVHAASRHGCEVTGITISREQYDFATRRVAQAGLQDRVSIQMCDYRKVEGQYDKIVSIEMLEAVGHEYHQAFFAACDRLLKPDGLLGVQVITCPDSRYDELRTGVDFIQRHIFPGSLLLSLGRIHEVTARTGTLNLHDLKDMGLDYARTLALWRERFNARLVEVRALGFDEAFIRKWNYYLSYCEGAFARRNISVVQAVFSRPNNPRLWRAEP